MKPLTRRVATLGVATLALASAVLAGTAGTALAIAAPVLAVNTSVLGSPTAAVAVATCPNGTNLVGTGGGIAQLVGSGNVVLTDIIPDVAAGTVTAWGHENGGYAGDWTVTAVAICDPLITSVRVAVATAANAATPKTVAPMCPGALRLTGLGYQLQGGNGQVFPGTLRPIGLGGALVTAYASPGYAANWNVTGYALCAAVPPGAAPLVVANATGPGAATPRDAWSGFCPAGTMLTGTGAELDPAAGGNVIIDQMNPTVLINQAHAQAAEPVAYAPNWDLVSYGICW